MEVSLFLKPVYPHGRDDEVPQVTHEKKKKNE